MKTKTIILFSFIFAVPIILAQTNTVPVVPVPTVSSQSQLWLGLIPLVVPLIVAVLKIMIDKLPSWVLPILAAGLGELLNYISGLAGGPTTTAINGLILGAAGTGLREIVDQLKQKNQLIQENKEKSKATP